MNGIFGAASEVQRVCDERSWRFCFIGGLAVQRWGEPRQTRDVDLTLLTGFGGEAAYVDTLLSLFEPRGEDPRAFALTNRVLLLLASNGVAVDVALGALPFEERAIERSSPWAVSADLDLTTCGAEDLLVYKAFAGRPRDWADAEMIVVRQGSGLDRDLVREELAPLLALKGADEDLARLEALWS